jgi:hypothetical protein
MLSSEHAIAFLEAINSHHRSEESGLFIPFTRKPCVFFEPPTNTKVEVLIEDGVGAESASMDIAKVMYKRLEVLYGLRRGLQSSEPGECWMLVCCSKGRSLDVVFKNVELSSSSAQIRKVKYQPYFKFLSRVAALRKESFRPCNISLFFQPKSERLS